MKIVQLKKRVEKYLPTSGNRYCAKRSILLRNKMIKSKLKLRSKLLEERRKKYKMFNAKLIIHSINADHDFYDLVTLFDN